MTAKQSALRLSAFSCAMFFSLFLFSFSCQDHVVPTNPVPATIQTLDVAMSGSIPNYGVQFQSLGNIPVMEYGIVFVDGTMVVSPEVNNTKVIFSNPVNLDPKFKTGPGLSSGPAGFVFSYRAYAILEGGTVVYGEAKGKIVSPE